MLIHKCNSCSYFSVGNEKKKGNLYRSNVLAAVVFLCLYLLSKLYFVMNIITRQWCTGVAMYFALLLNTKERKYRRGIFTCGNLILLIFKIVFIITGYRLQRNIQGCSASFHYNCFFIALLTLSCSRDPDIKRRKMVYDLKARLFKIGCHI